MSDQSALPLAPLPWLRWRPEPFATGAPMWDDPYVSSRLLEAHLDPETDLASRRPERIERSVAWLAERLALAPGDALLDLGCGPGLYAARLAARGLHVTGVDCSRRSIAYAREQARKAHLAIRYVRRDFLAIDYEASFDAVLQVYGELCVLSQERRDRFLALVHRALRPGGRFAFDVTTPRQERPLGTTWHVSEGGFWRPGPHLVLQRGIDYEDDLHLDEYLVVEADGAFLVYRNWFLDYTPETLVPVLESSGFRVESTWSDLEGTPYREGSEFLGVVAVRE